MWPNSAWFSPSLPVDLLFLSFLHSIELHKQLNLVAAADTLVSLPPSSAAFLPHAQFLAPAAMPPQAFPKPYLQHMFVTSPGQWPGMGGYSMASAAAGLPIYTESRQDNLTTKVKVGKALAPSDMGAHHAAGMGQAVHLAGSAGPVLGNDPKYSPY